MRILVLWSGGVESTSLLKHLLSETDHEVVAHYVKMINPEHRVTAEVEAIQKLLPRLQQIRHFTYSESEISVCGGRALPLDYTLHYPIAVAAMVYHKCHKIFRGACAEDEWMRMKDKTVVNLNPELPGTAYKEKAKIVETITGRSDLSPYLDRYGQPKSWHWNYLGDLAELTWSCRTPKENEECGTCHSCLERNAARNGTSYIKELQ